MLPSRAVPLPTFIASPQSTAALGRAGRAPCLMPAASRRGRRAGRHKRVKRSHNHNPWRPWARGGHTTKVGGPEGTRD